MVRSVRQSMDPVRRGVHGPGVSVFGSPLWLGQGMWTLDYGIDLDMKHRY